MPYIPPPMTKDQINNLVRHHVMSMQLAESRLELAFTMARINGILEFAGRDYRLTIEEVLALGVEAENALNEKTAAIEKPGKAGKALDSRPLAVRLRARVEKYKGVTVDPLVTDIALHEQSIEAITKLVEALEYCDQSGELPSPDILAMARALVAP